MREREAAHHNSETDSRYEEFEDDGGHKVCCLFLQYTPELGSVTKNETYPPVGTFRGGWNVYIIFHGGIFLRNVPTSGNVRTFRNELSFVTNPSLSYNLTVRASLKPFCPNSFDTAAAPGLFSNFCQDFTSAPEIP